jgi:hypothetical protein
MFYHASHVHSESGNVLIYILIAIVLLAALNFAFSQGSDSGAEGTLGKGEAVIAASDIMRYAGSVQQATRQLMRNEGCSENDISFNFNSASYAHSAPQECRVFDFKGGGLSYEAPRNKWVTSSQEWYFPDNVCIENVGTSSSCSSGNQDLVVMLPKLDSQICKQINKKLDINTGSNPPDVNWAGNLTNYYTGDFNSGNQIGGAMAGRRSGCFNNSGSGASGNHYYHVLMAR